MKKYLYSTLLFLFSISIFAQDEVPVNKNVHAPDVSEGVKNMSQGAKNSFTVFLRDADKKTVDNLWKDLMKNYDGKVKRVRKSDDDVAENVRIAAISGTETMNIYSQTEEQGDDVVLTVWYQLGNGNFIDSKEYSNTYKEIESMLQSFGVSVKREMVNQELKDEEKALGKLEKDLDRLVKQKEGLEKDIENYKNKILEAEQDIIKNQAEQETVKNQIEEQKVNVGEVSKRLEDIKY